MLVGRTVAGSIDLDVVARTERLPRAGESLNGNDLSRVPGGDDANQAVGQRGSERACG